MSSGSEDGLGDEGQSENEGYCSEFSLDASVDYDEVEHDSFDSERLQYVDTSDYDDDECSEMGVDRDFFYSDEGGGFYDWNEVCEVGEDGLLAREPKPNMDWEGLVPGINSVQDPHLIICVPWKPAALLDEQVWSSLPEEVFYKILAWLPPPAQARFRCVSKGTARFLSGGLDDSPSFSSGNREPSLTIKCNLRARHVRAYCHAENKWFDIPCNLVTAGAREPIEENSSGSSEYSEAGEVEYRWQLADVDGELFCYKSEDEENGVIRLALCNPMIPSSEIFLPACPGCYPHFIKLLVDRDEKRCKVVVVRSTARTEWVTAIFDSEASDWTVCERSASTFVSHNPGGGLLRHFAWNGAVYIRSSDVSLHVLDMASGTWSDAKVEFPGEILTRKFLIVSSKDQVMLVQVDWKSDYIVRVWKMVLGTSGDVRPFSAASWERQDIELPRYLRGLASEFRGCTAHGSEYLCFNGGITNQWIKYTFSTRVWQVMPCWGKRVAELEWFDWEAGLNINVRMPDRKQRDFTEKP